MSLFQISSFCKLALSELEVLTHPHGPSLSKLFLDSEKDEDLSQKSTLTFTSASTLKSLVDISATGDNAAERLVSENESVSDIPRNDIRPANTLSINEPVDKIEASTVTNDIGSSQLKDVSPSIADSHSSSEYGHSNVPNSKTIFLDRNERRRLCQVEEDMTSSKKLKIVGSVTKTLESDSFVASMLSDFVDTL